MMMRKELSLQHFYQLFKKNILLIVTLTVLGMCLSYLAMFHFVSPKYHSQAELFVNQRTEQQLIQFSEVQTSIQLINTYQALITGDSVMNQTAKAMGNTSSVSEIRQAVSIYQPENSQTFYISAEMTSPLVAQTVVTEVVKALEIVVNQIYETGEGNIHVLSLATYEPVPVSPSLKLYIIGGAAVAFMACIIMILFFDLIDSTIKDFEFFTQEGLMNIGVVYADEEVTASSVNVKHIMVTWLKKVVLYWRDKKSWLVNFISPDVNKIDSEEKDTVGDQLQENLKKEGIKPEVDQSFEEIDNRIITQSALELFRQKMFAPYLKEVTTEEESEFTK